MQRKKITEGFTEMRCRGRRYRDSEGVDGQRGGVEIGDQPIRGSGASSWVPPAGSGRSPATYAFSAVFECRRTL